MASMESLFNGGTLTDKEDSGQLGIGVERPMNSFNHHATAVIAAHDIDRDTHKAKERGANLSATALFG
jgi:hypothetical protein